MAMAKAMGLSHTNSRRNPNKEITQSYREVMFQVNYGAHLQGWPAQALQN